jgi:glutamate-ammonia-ligase adenylyltransferase
MNQIAIPHASWPRPADPGAAERLAERFAELGRTEARLARSHEIAGLLACLGGNSPFLADLALREADSLRDIVARGPSAVVAAAMAGLRSLPPRTARPRLASALRRAKRIVALACAIADIGGSWTLEQVTAALSELAETALQLSLMHLLRAAHDAREIALPHPDDPVRDCGFAVLGMGKLGARELNYSSDIDLVLLYDPDCGVYSAHGGAEAMGACTTRISRGLVALMEARDADGYVFRTDLRLRPDPAATPPVVSLTAALTYYESMGQNWERAAMIKARPVAGDLPMGAQFLAEIRPFIWRRGLDFASVADIHAMKQRIDLHKGGALGNHRDPAARIAGHNVKLGEGGIREIEFLAQTMQLVLGGRDPTLRVPTTLGALNLLARAGHLPRAASRALAQSYRFLRQVEHRLQMVADRQTHDIPEKPEDLHRVALFLGYDDADGFARALLAHLHRVRAHYMDVFGAAFAGAGELARRLDFREDTLAPQTADALTELGFTNNRSIYDTIRGWQAGRSRALRSERARDLLTRLLPALLTALSRQPNPDQVFFRLDSLLARLPAGVQILSLIERNPALLDRIAAVLGAAPMLADHLARHQAALDGLIAPEQKPAPARLLKARLTDASILEEAIDIIRRTVREEDFSISVATMEGRLGTDAAGLARTVVADAALAALLPRVLADFAARNGRVRGGAMAVVALGKAGGQEMMAGSDLDLMLIYDHPTEVTESRGARSLPVSQWFVRAAHAMVAAITAPGVDGPLYDVDMRLRPSGNKGPVAVSLAAFRRYHAEDAWTWERMALTRARVIAGPPALRAAVQTAIRDSLAHADPPAKIRADAA